MAATHLSRYFQDAELVQIIDPRIPTIGVGEGTTPGFHLWLDEITGVPFEDLRRDLRVTKKRGVRFENWGQHAKVFDHAFVPANATGLHLSVTQLVVFLRRYVRGDIIDAHVSDIHGSDDGAEVVLEDGRRIQADVAIDARGFPRVLDDSHVNLAWIPTNAAMVTRTAVVNDLEWTRAVARPHGWIFVIPLSVDTAYGYIYGGDAASYEEVRADFDLFLASDGITEYTEPRSLRFPNFLCKAPFEGRVLKIGNAASFIEPLEATSIAVTRYELNFLTAWLRAF